MATLMTKLPEAKIEREKIAKKAKRKTVCFRGYHR